MEKKNWSVYERRRDTVKRKARELSSLCNVEVCVLCFGPAGDFTSWPEEPSRVCSVIDKYRRASHNAMTNKRMKRENLSLSDVLDSKIKALHKQLSDHTPPNLDLFSKESLEALAGCLESKLQAIERRIGVLDGVKNSQQQQVECFSQPGFNSSDQKRCDYGDDDHEDPEFSAVMQSLLYDSQQPNYGIDFDFGERYENGQSLLGSSTVLVEPIRGSWNY